MTGQHVFSTKNPASNRGVGWREGGPAAKLRRRAGGGSVISTERGTGLAADVLRRPYSVWELDVPYCAYSVCTSRGRTSSPGNEVVTFSGEAPTAHFNR